MTPIMRFCLGLILIITGCIINPFDSAGQSSLDYNWYVNVNGGATQLYGDISNEDNPIGKLSDETDFGYGFRLGRFLSPVFNAHFQIINGTFSGQKDISNLKYKSNFTEFQLGGTANLSNLFFGPKSRFFNVYAFLGIGAILYRSEAWNSTTGAIVGDAGYAYGPERSKSTPETGIVAPVGIGIDFKIADKWYINFENALRVTSVDNIDGVGKGTQNDAYYYTSVGLTYNFGTKQNKRIPVKPELETENPKIASTTYVNLDYIIPENLISMDTFEMKSTIHKGNLSGKGELTQILPIGFEVLDTVIDNARMEYKNYTLSLYWDNLPEDSVFDIKYRVKLDKIYGDLPMVSILHFDQTGEEYRFKKDIFIKRKIVAEPLIVQNEIPEEKEMKSPSENVEFRIQVSASLKKQLSMVSLEKKFSLPGLITEEKIGDWYKYTAGSFKTYKEAKEYRKKLIREHNAVGAFIIAYYQGKRLNTLSELKDISPDQYPYATKTKYKENGTCYRVQIMALVNTSASPQALKDMYDISQTVNEEIFHNWRKYTVGDCLDKQSALSLRKVLIAKGLDGAFLVAYKNGERASFATQ